MGDFRNVFRERMDREEEGGGGRPEVRLRRPSPQFAGGIGRGAWTSLAASGILLMFGLAIGILSYAGFLGPRTQEAGYQGKRNVPPIPLTVDDDLRWEGKKFSDDSAETDIQGLLFWHFLDRIWRLYGGARDLSPADRSTAEPKVVNAIYETLQAKGRELVERDRVDLLKRREQAYQGIKSQPRGIEWQLAWMLFDHPEVSRGKFFRVEGSLLLLYPQVIQRDPPVPLTLAVIQENQTRQPVHCYLLQPAVLPPEAEVKEIVGADNLKYRLVTRTYVQMEGVFLRLRKDYETGDGGRKTAAVFLATGFRVIPPPPRPPSITDDMAVMLIVAFAAMLLLGVVAYFAVRRGANRSLRIEIGKARFGRAAKEAVRQGPSDWRTIEEP